VVAFAFTMDEDLSRAVRKSFVQLYEDRVIYRGNRIVNWCPNDPDCTFGFRSSGRQAYPVLSFPRRRRRSPVATHAPETMLGDTAVAVNQTTSAIKVSSGKTLIHRY